MKIVNHDKLERAIHWLGSKLMSFAGVFWLSETTYFIIKHGWHWRAINEYEQAADGIVITMLTLGTACYIYLFCKMIDDIYNTKL